MGVATLPLRLWKMSFFGEWGKVIICTKFGAKVFKKAGKWVYITANLHSAQLFLFQFLKEAHLNGEVLKFKKGLG